MRPSDPRVLVNASLVIGLFWLHVWSDFLLDLMPRERPDAD